jgi:predicted amidohydrolase
MGVRARSGPLSGDHLPLREDLMTRQTLTVAIVTDAFPNESEWPRLLDILSEAKGVGGELAVLPEIPLNPWSPASKEPREEDAEEVNGPRQTFQAEAAARAGIALLGGAIIRDPGSGVRHNTGLLFGADGACLARYRKVHLPEEEGYWETSHYEPGTEPPTVVEGLSMPVGIQLCSDVNRTTGFQLLSAQGAEAVLAPRCTPPQTYDRWRLVLRANAVTSCAYVVSANRPAHTPDGLIGGASLAIGPSAEVLVETMDPLTMVTLDRQVVRTAKAEYPGYLKVYPELYARGWREVGER